MASIDKHNDKAAMFSLPVDLIPLCYQSLDKKGCYLEVNQKFLETLGYKKEEVIGKWFGDFISRDYVSNFKRNFKHFKTEGEIHHAELELIKKNGEIIIVHFDGKIEYDEDGNFKRTHCFFKDISEKKRLEDKALKSEKEKTMILDTMFELFAVYDKNLTIQWANKAAANSVNLCQEELVGKYCYNLWAQRKNPCPNCPVLKAVKQKTVQEGEISTPDGRSWFVRGFPLLNEKGEITGAIEFGQDITERKEAEEALRESEEKFKTIFENTPLGIFRSTPEGQFLEVNSHLAKLLGYDNPEDVLNNVKDIAKDVYVKTNERHPIVQETLISDDVKVYENVYKKKNGEHFTANLYLKRLYDHKLNKYVFEGIVEDITKIKEARDELKKNEQKFRSFVNQSYEGILIINKEGIITEWNKALQNITGYLSNEVIGKYIWDINYKMVVNPSDPSTNLERIKKITIETLRKKESPLFNKIAEYNIQNKQGKLITIQQINFPIQVPGDFMIGSLILDITERKNTEKQLHDTSALLESTLNAIPDVIGIQGKNHEIIRYNHAGYKFLGLTHEEVFGKKCYMLVGRKHPCEICATKEVYKTKKPAHVIRYEKTMQKWLDLRSYPVLDNDGEIAMVIEHFRDITEKIRSEQELNKIRIAMEQSPAAIIITSKDGIIEYINPKFVELTGYESQEAIGKTPAILKSGKHDPKFYAELWETITSGKEWSGEFINKKKNGKLFWEKALISPIKDEAGKVTHFVAIKENITDKKRLEQVRHEKKLAERSAELKQRFLANMSHEMRTPMNGIIGMTDLLNNTSLNNIQEEYVDIIKKSSENLLHLINDILDITRIEEGKLSLVHSNFNLRNTILNTFNLFYPVISQKDITLDITIPETYPPALHTDEHRLKQVISNLLSNAIKYTDKGSIVIAVKEIEKQDDMVVTQINVTDTGIGIKEKDKNHVFDVFSRVDDTVTRKTEGTGLGLAISREIAKLLGGDIGVESTEGKGSTFWFTFKAKISKDGAIKAGQNGMPISQNIDMNVLFAEDKKVNQKVVSLMLENANCSVTIAENGHKVLEEYKKKPFDVILMDIMMPGMDGITAMKKLKEKYSNLPPIIGLSANAMKGDKEKYLQEGLDDYITKPVNQQTLYKKLLKWKMDK